MRRCYGIEDVQSNAAQPPGVRSGNTSGRHYAVHVRGSRQGIAGGSSCRFCHAPLELTVVDLGMSPLCESIVAPEALDEGELFYPLHPRVCTRCWLVQIPQFVGPAQIFTEYAYFSGFATSWVEHPGATSR